jgi:protein ImuB
MDPNCAEIFLKFSPRVQIRKPGYLFIDIESTSGLHGGEFKLMKAALQAARKFASNATAAIADTAYFAQALVHYKPFEISPSGEDHKILFPLPVSILREMEGLEPWSKVKSIEHVIGTFQNVGFHTFEDLFHLELSQFRERWGELGVTIWKRVHEREKQVIAPLISQEPLSGYCHLDDPISLQQFLEPYVKKQLEYLFMRLEGLGRFAKKAEITLHCEYSNKKYFIPVEPVKPNRDLNLFFDLFCKRLSELDLENPIREFEIYIYDVPEKVTQLDFFEPRDVSEDKWRRLISFAKAAGCNMGFLQIENSYLPEASYSLKDDWSQDLNIKDVVEFSEEAIQIKTSYGKALLKSPRPSLLLKEPSPMPSDQIKSLKFLTQLPQERVESPWWKSWIQKFPQRDYYFAFTATGQLLWVFQNAFDQNYYLHGYFD